MIDLRKRISRALTETQDHQFLTDLSHHNQLSDDQYDMIGQLCSHAVIRTTYGVTSDRLYATHFRELSSRGVVCIPYLFVRHVDTPQFSAHEQWAAFSNDLRRVTDYLPPDHRVCFDLEMNERWDGRLVRVPYLARVDMLMQAAGGPENVFIYTSPGFFESVGAPVSWLAAPWWLAHWAPMPSDSHWLAVQDRTGGVTVRQQARDGAAKRLSESTADGFVHYSPANHRLPVIAWQWTSRFLAGWGSASGRAASLRDLVDMSILYDPEALRILHAETEPPPPCDVTNDHVTELAVDDLVDRARELETKSAALADAAMQLRDTLRGSG